MLRLFLQQTAWLVALCLLGFFIAMSALFFYSAAYARQDLIREKTFTAIASHYSWSQGIVESVDLSASIVVVRVASYVDNNTQPLRLHIIRSTDIQLQDFIQDSGVIIGTTVRKPGTIHDLTVGRRIAFLLENRPETQSIVAQLILVGDIF